MSLDVFRPVQSRFNPNPTLNDVDEYLDHELIRTIFYDAVNKTMRAKKYRSFIYDAINMTFTLLVRWACGRLGFGHTQEPSINGPFFFFFGLSTAFESLCLFVTILDEFLLILLMLWESKLVILMLDLACGFYFSS